MTSSLDWAGLVPAVTATAQAVAVMVQVYWDRRQRGTRATEHDDCRRVPGHGKAALPDTGAGRVQVSVVAPARTSPWSSSWTAVPTVRTLRCPRRDTARGSG